MVRLAASLDFTLYSLTGILTLEALTVIRIKFPLVISTLIQTPELVKNNDMNTQGEFSCYFNTSQQYF